MGGNPNSLATADQFAQSLTSLGEEQKIVSFCPQHDTVENAEWLERVVKETLRKPTQITSALTIPTPAGAAIVSLTSTQTTPPTSSTTCALSMSGATERSATGTSRKSVPEGGESIVGRAP